MSAFAVPGWIYHECLDPLATEWPRENPDIAKPTTRARGFGFQYVYEVTDEQRERMLDHIRIFGEALSHGADPETMYMARKIVRWMLKQ